MAKKVGKVTWPAYFRAAAGLRRLGGDSRPPRRSGGAESRGLVKKRDGRTSTEVSMSRMIILRGVSGSGKSTVAKEHAAEEMLLGGKAVICSADDYFIRLGSYKFDPRLLPEAHAWCRGKAVGALESEVDLVIIDNTNLCRWEFEPYEKMASDYGVECKILVVGEFDEKSIELYASRNQHGVPAEKIKQMAAKFQK